MTPLTSSKSFLCPSGSELAGCFLLSYTTTKEGQQLEGEKKDAINLQFFLLLLL